MSLATIVITSAALCVGYAYHHLSKKIDSVVEQMAEAVIEKEAGIKIDFSSDAKKKGPEDRTLENSSDK